MAISNLTATVDKTTVKAGDTVRFTLSWNGSADYTDKAGKTWIGKYLTIKGTSSWVKLEPITQTYFDGNVYSFNYKIPDDWVGSKSGSFTVVWIYYDGASFRTAEIQFTNTVSVYVKGVLKPVVTLTPTDPVIYPGQSATFGVNVSGVEAPFTITNYKWIYSLNPIGGNTKTLTIPFDNVGYEYCHCEVTIEKSGYDLTTARGSSKLTMAKGSFDNISVMLNSVSSDPKIFTNFDISASVLGVPEGAKAYYSWMLDGVKIGSEPTLSYASSKAGEFELKLITQIIGSDYEAKSIESPIIPINVRKLTLDDIYPKIRQSSPTVWGPGSKTVIDWTLIHNTPQFKPDFIEFTPDPNVELKEIKINGVPNASLTFEKNEGQYYTNFTHLWPSLLGRTLLTTEMTLKEDDHFEGGVVDLEAAIYCTNAPGNFKYFVSDAGHIQPDSVFYVKAMPNTEVKFSIKNIFDDLDQPGLSQEYKDELRALSLEGVYELVNKDNEVEVTAIGNEFTYTVPSEAKTLKGKIRHTLKKGIFTVNPYIAEQDIVIDIVSNPMQPIPTLSVVQTPNPVRLGSEVVFSRKFSDLPEGSDIETSEWTINNSVKRQVQK